MTAKRQSLSTANHSLSAQDTKCLILDISYEFAQQFDESLYRTVFAVVNGSGAQEELHNLLWQLSRTVSEKELPGLRQYSIITDILHVLFVQCRSENPNIGDGESNIQSRLVKLTVEYIQQHYREEILEKHRIKCSKSSKRNNRVIIGMGGELFICQLPNKQYYTTKTCLPESG